MSAATHDSGAGATGDYYCEVCDVKMNAFATYESHCSGKKHIKNLQKNTGKANQADDEPPPIKAKIEDALDEITEPIIGLYKLTETQYPDSTIHPSYFCHLCRTQLGIMGVVDHVTSTKHRLNYIKENDPDGHIIMESMRESKVPLDGIAQERAVTLEEIHGRGKVEVKVEKSKFGYLASMRKRRQDDNEGSPQKKSNNDGFRRYDVDDDYEAKTEQFLRRIPYFDTDTKLQVIERLSLPIISNDEEAKSVLGIITMIEQLLMQYNLQNLCTSGQEDFGRPGNMGGMDTMRLNMQRGLPGANLGPRPHPMSGTPMGGARGFEGPQMSQQSMPPMGRRDQDMNYGFQKSFPMASAQANYQSGNSNTMMSRDRDFRTNTPVSYPIGRGNQGAGYQQGQQGAGYQQSQQGAGYQQSQQRAGYQQSQQGAGYQQGQQGQFSSNLGKSMSTHWGRFN